MRSRASWSPFPTSATSAPWRRPCASASSTSPCWSTPSLMRRARWAWWTGATASAERCPRATVSPSTASATPSPTATRLALGATSSSPSWSSSPPSPASSAAFGVRRSAPSAPGRRPSTPSAARRRSSRRAVSAWSPWTSPRSSSPSMLSRMTMTA